MEQLGNIQSGLPGFQKAIQEASNPLEQIFALCLKHWDDMDKRGRAFRMIYARCNEIPESLLPAIIEEAEILEKRQSVLLGLNIPNVAVMEKARQELYRCVVRYIFLKNLLRAKTGQH